MSHRRIASPYVALDRSLCEACWECVETCPQGVIGKVEVFRHRHARMNAAERCTGCCRCVRVCKAGALSDLRARVQAGNRRADGTPAP